MTATIMTRPQSQTTVAVSNPEYAYEPCGTWHAGACTGLALQQLGELVRRMVRESDARLPRGRKARRTLQEMVPGYERQPVLVLHRPLMNDACGLCGRWNCTGTDCPPGFTAPAAASVTVTGSGGWQCDTCGNWFGVTAAGPAPVTAWTCAACANTGR
ncbi:hypothetical protein ABZT03_40515 [Streptomyces sp. NPDC005574]|uniref:hypothetical protein n=1 Tax=Streptomyces sp. NPDC005574 TaxID=3156891 RepID=UPI0033B38FD9